MWGNAMWEEAETTFSEADAVTEAFQNVPDEDDLLDALELEF